MYRLEAFYLKHQKTLEQNYPGITLSRLRREFADNPLCSKPTALIFKKLLAGEPLSYIFKQCFFYSSFFYVNEHVLIPRLESELLVHEALQLVKEGDRLAEIGIGSGALSLSILKEAPFALHITATDIDESAVQVAKINLFRHQYCLSSNKSLDIKCGDRLEGVHEEFAGIISNPPYIREKADADAVHPKVAEYEPKIALYLPDEAYDLWFTDFFKDVYNKLKPGGFFLMEGHERHLEHLAELLENSGLQNIQVIKDLTGRDRILKGTK